MQRRGPRKTIPIPPVSRPQYIVPTSRSGSSDRDHDLINAQDIPHSSSEVELNMALVAPLQPCALAGLTIHESFLLDHYVQRFSRTYPTFSGPSNPFLSILLPLATQHHAVMSAVLALSGAQFEGHTDTGILKATLRARHRALEDCRALLHCLSSITNQNCRNFSNASGMEISQTTDILCTLACCICLLLYEKIVGDGKANWMPHLNFLAQVFDRLEVPGNNQILQSIKSGDQQKAAFDFIHHLFLYNDLVHSTARRTSTLSTFYLRSLTECEVVYMAQLPTNTIQTPSERHVNKTAHSRFYYPYLVAKISAGDENVSDACIDAWDGRLDWLPSLSVLGLQDSLKLLPTTRGKWRTEKNNLQTPNEFDPHQNSLTIAIYCETAKVYLRQCLRCQQGHATTPQSGLAPVDLACHTTFLISQLPHGSGYESSLLWPIGIIGPELTLAKSTERQYLLDRLRALEQRFQMKHFQRVREALVEGWNWPSSRPSPNNSHGQRFNADIFLFG